MIHEQENDMKWWSDSDWDSDSSDSSTFMGITVVCVKLGLVVRREHDVQVIEHRHHGDGAEEHQHGAEDPQHERQRRVEEAVADGVEREAPLEQLRHVIRGDDAVGGLRRAVDEEVDLVGEADGEGVADEGEEEDEEERHVFQRHHELAVRPVYGVV